MSELTDTINAINAVFAQSGNIPIPQVPESISIAEYLALVDQLQTRALAKVDESIGAAQLAAALGLDVSNVLQQLTSYRNVLTDLRVEIFQTLAGFNTSLSLQDAWNKLAGNDQNPEDPPVVTWPDDGAVVLSGTVAMLLRKNDAAVPAELVWTPAQADDRKVSPLISTNGESWTIGSKQNLSLTEVIGDIKASSIDATKDLLKASIGELELLSQPIKAGEAYELGELINNIGGRYIDFIGFGLDVLNNQMSISDFNQRFDNFANQTQQTVEEKALSETASRFPNGNWWATPIVDSFFGLTYQLRDTNSFELEIARNGQATDGKIGGVILGSFKDDTLIAGNGRVLLAGGEGNDLIIAGSGQQWFSGNNGIDTVKFALPKDAFSVSKDGDTWLLETVDDSYRLHGVERLQFSDSQMALDVDAGQSAGNTLRLLISALGKDLVTPQLLGVGIAAFDRGITLQQAADFLLAMPEYLSLPGSGSNETFVARIFTNVTGSAPNNDQLNYFTGLLQGSGGTLSRADLLTEAALSISTEELITLIGITNSGVEFG